MADNFYITSSNDSIDINDFSDSMIVCDENFDTVSILFEFLFTTEQSLKSRNKYLLLFLQNYINEDIEIVKKFFLDDAIEDLDISLIKSSLLISDNIIELEDSRKRLCSIFDKNFQ